MISLASLSDYTYYIILAGLGTQQLFLIVQPGPDSGRLDLQDFVLAVASARLS
jgi:hypothetical protein